MLSNLIKAGLLFFGTLVAGESVRLIRLDVFRPQVGDHFPVGGVGLEFGAISQSLDDDRAGMVDPDDSFPTETLESMMGGEFDFLFLSFQVVESRAVTVAEGSFAMPATDDLQHLTALESIAAVASYLLGSRPAAR